MHALLEQDIPLTRVMKKQNAMLTAMGTDADGGSSLYILDAHDMSLMARCRSPIALPAGFHGEWVDT